jgi:hypothetical protein
MKIEMALLQETLDYLSTCPYKDVVGLLNKWAKCNHESKPEEQHVGDDEAQHGITEEFKTLVIDLPGTAVRQRLGQQFFIRESVTQKFLAPIRSCRH